MENVLDLASQWFIKLERLQQHGLYQAAILESGTRKLLDVVYPEKGLYDANTRKANHPAVDILSRDNKFGVQVKLTLRPHIIREARENWKKETLPQGSIPGATELWILGAGTDPRTPDRSSGAWEQVEHQEWSVITEKLDLDNLNVEALKSLCSILQEEMQSIPEDLAGMSTQVRGLHRNVRHLLKKGLLRKDQDRTMSYDDLYLLPQMEGIEEKIAFITSANENITRSLNSLPAFINDIDFETSLETLNEATEKFSRQLSGAVKKYEEQQEDKRAGRVHGAPDPAGQLLSSQYLSYVAAMNASYGDAIDAANQVREFLESEFRDLFVSHIDAPPVT